MLERDVKKRAREEVKEGRTSSALIRLQQRLLQEEPLINIGKTLEITEKMTGADPRQRTIHRIRP